MKKLITAFLFIFTVNLSAQDFDKVTFEGEEYYLLPNDFEPHKTIIKDQYPNYINNFKLPDGKWILFLESFPEFPYVIGKYRNGLAEGTWKFYSINWEDTTSYIYFTNEYVNGKRNGSQLYYDEPGVLIQRFDFKDDLYHGEFFTYNSLGIILANGQYMYGIPTGKWESYNHDGSTIRIESYKDHIHPDSIKHYSDKDKLTLPEIRVINLHDFIYDLEYIPSAEGMWIEYYRDETTRSEKTYSGGLLKYVTEYYENGKIKNHGATIAGVDYGNVPLKRSYTPNEYIQYIKTGTWEYCDENGNLVKTEQYEKGKLVK